MFRPNQRQTGKCGECDRPAKSRGLCGTHYSRARYNGLIIIRDRSDRLTRYLAGVLRNIKLRCDYPGVNGFHRYGGRGIKNFLTLEQLQQLYERDSGHLLSKPSIDRIDSDGDYTFDNCRFIEFLENTRRAISKPRSKCKRCNAVTYRTKSRLCKSCKPFGICRICSNPFPRKKSENTRFCNNCRFVTKQCPSCNASITRDRGRQPDTFRNKYWFCSKDHQGKWFGKNFGRGAQARARKAAA